jgi:hypothetical protein
VPLFLIERDYAEQLEVSAEVVKRIEDVNEDVGVNWVYSFLSSDKKKTYCLYEAADPAFILEAARRAGLPADVIIEVNQIRPEAYV